MKLYLDTSNSEKIIIKLDEQVYEAEARKEKSQKLLPFIQEILKQNNMSFQDISEIKVNTGPGSFTGLRVGLSVANALGWQLSVPVNNQSISKDGPVTASY